MWKAVSYHANVLIRPSARIARSPAGMTGDALASFSPSLQSLLQPLTIYGEESEPMETNRPIATVAPMPTALPLGAPLVVGDSDLEGPSLPLPQPQPAPTKKGMLMRVFLFAKAIDGKNGIIN